ncbi:glycosyltransferase family 4 protein [candidate division KSB1 bacterium]|nr:glycosyltransferase family 4 protein [candidate division KSB1 bacterium]NIV71082.1 glycosyltransferase [Phycisphaerae bacterium]NIR72361.1 glycosyltransferase family 4 protein [candidate division KSB1 bacterium]NIS28364.1 glycosyltransferase family 4 protein [candidate division KSB1 bacterium]NIT75245.1 glycosyltransferase family 4 protein [candidate division KSB1 bacterium]
MRIVFTFPWAPQIPGGGPIDYYQTAHYLRAAGAEIILLPIASSGPSRFPRPRVSESLLHKWQKQDLLDKSVQVEHVPQNLFHYFLDGLSVRKALLKILARERVDAVLGWQHDVAFLPPLLRSESVILGMIASNGYFAEWYQNCSRLGRFLRNWMVVRPLRQADVVFARSNFMRKLVIDLFGLDSQRVSVSYCGVNPLFGKARRHATEEISKFFYFGCFSREKGLFDALQAFGRVAAQGKQNWTFKIAGWGDEEPVRHEARENGIADRIEVVGHLTQSDLLRELEWAHLAILPSHGESFGFAFAEAQSSGLPVIGYEVGGVPEIVEHDVTGWLVPKGSVDGLAEKIVEAIFDPQKTFEMGLTGRERVNRLFSWSRTAEATLKKLEEIKAKYSAKDSGASSIESIAAA